jgi:prepilin-type N-terminal cleavage/methylation domain-containing protein
MRRVRGFTLIELLFVIVIFGILIGVIFSIYAQMISIKTTLEARQTLIDRSYFLMEKLHVTMSDYTIDYEEYYNRSIV